MSFTRMLRTLLTSKQARQKAGPRRLTRLPRLDDLEFNVIPATDDGLYDQDVRPALLAQIISAKKGRQDRSGLRPPHPPGGNDTSRMP